MRGRRTYTYLAASREYLGVLLEGLHAKVQVVLVDMVTMSFLSCFGSEKIRPAAFFLLENLIYDPDARRRQRRGHPDSGWRGFR